MSETSKEQEIVENLKARLGQSLLDVRIQRPRRIFATVSQAVLLETIGFLSKECGLRHLATITAIDLGNDIGVYYHLRDQTITLNLKVTTPKTDPKLPTILPIIPGAVLYEREIHDLFGVVFEGHPDLSPVILPEGWPKGVYPLRKEWKPAAIMAEVAKAEGDGL